MQETGFDPWIGRSPGEGNGNPLWFSCLGDCMDRGAWWAIGHGVKKEWDMAERLDNNKSCVLWRKAALTGKTLWRWDGDGRELP